MTTSLPLGYISLPKKSLLAATLVEDASDRHLITVAPTGAGKGVSCIIPALLSWAGPAVVVDPKGENYAVTSAHRKALGQKVYVIDPFGVTDVTTSDRLNPLDLLAMPGASAADDVSSIVNLLMNETATIKGDPFWDERAGALLSGVLAGIIVTAKSPAPLGALFNLLNDGYDNLVVLGQSLLSSERPEIRAAGAVLDPRLSSKTGASITATAQSHLSFLRNPSVAASLGPSTIPLDDVVSGAPMTIFLVLPPDKLRSHSKALRLWLGTILIALSRRKTQPSIPTLLLLDEAAQLGRMDELRTALTLLRGYGVKVWSFWQDLSQLRRLYPSDWQSLLNNCGVQQFFGGVSPFAAMEIEAYLAGMAPRPIYTMPRDQMALLNGSGAPLIVDRVNYLDDARLRGRAQRNPYYPSHAHKGAEIIPMVR